MAAAAAAAARIRRRARQCAPRCAPRSRACARSARRRGHVRSRTPKPQLRPRFGLVARRPAASGPYALLRARLISGGLLSVSRGWAFPPPAPLYQETVSLASTSSACAALAPPRPFSSLRFVVRHVLLRPQPHDAAAVAFASFALALRPRHRRRRRRRFAAARHEPCKPSFHSPRPADSTRALAACVPSSPRPRPPPRPRPASSPHLALPSSSSATATRRTPWPRRPSSTWATSRAP